MSWIKKNEMDLKRHVQELRENITNNWTTTGQELSRELRQFWPQSRPQSPARLNSNEMIRLPTTPGGNPINSNQLLTGYALGLVGGVRSWVRQPPFFPLCPPPPSPKARRKTHCLQMTKNRRNVPGSRPVSDDDSEESDENARQADAELEAAVDLLEPSSSRA